MMQLHKRVEYWAFKFVLIAVVSGCAPSPLAKNACAIADQRVDLSTMLKSNITNIYDVCLSNLRKQVALELD
jgi:hypothetical protein